MNNEYMFGKSILVAPILYAQYTPETVVKADENEGWNRNEKENGSNEPVVDFTEHKTHQVYLPAGSEWYDFWTNEKHDGGKYITTESTIDNIPLYVKAGSILPIGPQVQYATEKPWDNLSIKIYEGANGTFTLYEDEFDNYNYESGAFTEIPFTWNEKTKKLTIGKRAGRYAGMIPSRKFTVTLADGSQKVVNYNGKKVDVKF